MDVFRFFRPGGPKEDQAGKRRAQVRRAQQTYRLRKDQYTKSLENEVIRLRTIETNLLLETQHLHSTVQTLRDLLGYHGILPDPTRPASEKRWTDLCPNLVTDFHVAEEAQPNASQVPPVEETSYFWPEFRQDTGLVSQQANPRTSLEPSVQITDDHQVQSIPAPSGFQRARLGSLDTVTMGMEFVLALEAPCLAHIHGDVSSPGGHALTVSSHLLAISPPSSMSPSLPLPKDVQEACGRTPASILDGLLRLSANLALGEGEVTPVKAWDRIQSLPHFDRLGVDKLRALAGKLAQAVECHGFGAVFQELVFEKLLREVFAEGWMV